MVFDFTHNGHYYEIYDDLKTWAEAKTSAAGKTINGVSGYLAEINSTAENTAIFNALQNNTASFTQIASDGGNARYAWIGANDNQTEGTWVWDNSGINFWTGQGQFGSAQGGNYNNWGNNTFQYEPDNFQSNQDAAAMALDNWPIGVAGQWNDIGSFNTMPYVVEYNAVPEPSQIALALGLAALLFCRCRRGSA
jgi:hypothetical protein